MKKTAKEKEKKSAKKRVEILFGEASQAFKKDKKAADRFVKAARRLAMKHNLKLPKEQQRNFCKYCYCYSLPGENCRVRAYKGKMVYHCFDCGQYSRFPFVRELKEKRKKSSTTLK